MEVLFSKYHGIGNDFIIIDNRQGKYHLDENTRRRMCERRLGIGADGMIEIMKSSDQSFKFVYFNSDGKVGSLCGNGARCSIKYCIENKIISSKEGILLEAYDGVHEGGSDESLTDIFVKFRDVPKASLSKYDDDTFFIDTGSPHVVKFVFDVADIDVLKLGKEIRNSKPFKTEGVNVNFVQILSHEDVLVRTYERGVEEETYSCGTGAVAAALVMIYRCSKGLIINDCFNVAVRFKHGELHVSFTEKENTFTNIKLIGPACHVYDGIFMTQSNI